jgi:outer membrane biosynthesis protein TonB
MAVLILILIQILVLAFWLKIIFSLIDKVVAAGRRKGILPIRRYRWRWIGLPRLQLPRLQLGRLRVSQRTKPPETPKTQPFFKTQPPEPPKPQLPKPPEPPKSQLPKPTDPPKIKLAKTSKHLGSEKNQRDSKIERESIKRFSSYSSWNQLLIRLQYDNRVAERLITGLMLKFPEKSDRWYIEKAIHDLERDRRR